MAGKSPWVLEKKKLNRHGPKEYFDTPMPDNSTSLRQVRNDITIYRDEKFNHGETKTVLLSSPDDIGNPVAAEILWTAKTGQVLNLKNLEVDKVALDGEG